MAAKQPPGIRHVTVVPTNFDPDDEADDRDETAGRTADDRDD